MPSHSNGIGTMFHSNAVELVFHSNAVATASVPGPYDNGEASI